MRLLNKAGLGNAHLKTKQEENLGIGLYYYNVEHINVTCLIEEPGFD